MSELGFNLDLDGIGTTASAHSATLALPRSAVRDRGDFGGTAKGLGESFQEAGSWFRYVPRARVSSYAQRGWCAMDTGDPLEWSVLMRWRGPEEPAAP
jgi:hypothetical protein